MVKRYFEGKREEPVFRYAVITDTHFRPEEGDESSPWKVNRYSNDRARWIIDQINRANPDFVVHMGDVVHPLPRSSTYGSAAEAALKAFSRFEAPLYLIPGNHDVGDKNNPRMPASVVDDFSLNLYAKCFGPLYRSFDHKGVHFILINALALNSGLRHGAEHSRWLEADLEANRSRRIHIFSHYPPYVLEPGEPSNYDNIDETDRSWLLQLLKEYEAEVLFAGHVHQFIYNKHGTTDCYNIPATSFVRQDYSEMFRVEAADEYGRDDVHKLGWCIVDVYEDTHIAKICRSYGATLKEDETPHSGTPKVRSIHTRESVIAPLGVHLRHPWAEEIDLPFNGPMDEFIRKRVRNDYILLGFWECGIRKLRVPLSDLLNETIRARMRALTSMGHSFCVFSFGIPSDTDSETLKSNRDLVRAFEIVLPWRNAEEAIPHLIRFREQVPVPLFLAKIESSSERRHEGSRFSHFVSSGFRFGHREDIEEFLRLKKAKEVVDGFVFEIGAEESPWDAIQAIGFYSASKDLRAMASVRLASENPAEYLSDDIRVANRVAEAVMVATAETNMDVFLDTFMDVDRGYFPRVGLYDRRCNRRLGSHVLANAQGALDEYGPVVTLGGCMESDDGKTLVCETHKAIINLFLPHPGKAHERRLALPGDTGERGLGNIIDLESGTISKAFWNRIDKGLVISNSSPCKAPSLFIIEKMGTFPKERGAHWRRTRREKKDADIQ